MSVCASFLFAFEGGMWDLIGLIPDQNLSFYFSTDKKHFSCKGIHRVIQKVVPLSNDLWPYYVITNVTWGITFDEISVSLNCCITGLSHTIDLNKNYVFRSRYHFEAQCRRGKQIRRQKLFRLVKMAAKAWRCTHSTIRARGYKTFFMLNSNEHEIFPAHIC